MWLVENTKIVPRDAFEDMCACAAKAFVRSQLPVHYQQVLLVENLDVLKIIFVTKSKHSC
jgi:hypothetical protein